MANDRLKTRRELARRQEADGSERPTTNAEPAQTLEVADLAHRWLCRIGFPEDSLVNALSGNGSINTIIDRPAAPLQEGPYLEVPRGHRGRTSHAHFAYETRLRV